MSCLAEHVTEQGVRKMKALVKGAPEALELLLKDVPLQYK